MSRSGLYPPAARPESISLMESLRHMCRVDEAHAMVKIYDEWDRLHAVRQLIKLPYNPHKLLSAAKEIS